MEPEVHARTYENDPYERFARDPPSSSADWGWVQHMLASLAPTGRMAVVLDTGAVSRGSGNQGSNKERDIRKEFVDEDLVEAVLLLPDNLFYNTIVSRHYPGHQSSKRHQGDDLAHQCLEAVSKGRPKNYIAEEQVERVVSLYRSGRPRKGCR